LTRRRRASGLTLLEMMVVLMIASMAMALGYQSLSQWQRAETSMASVGGQLRRLRLTQAWLDGSLSGLTPIEEAPFAGTADGLQGTTTRPILASQGGQTPIAWAIRPGQGAVVLELQEGAETIEIPLEGAVTAHFSYLDRAGKAYPQWPPKLGLNDQLPAAIALVQESDDAQIRTWIAAVAGITNPPKIPPLFEPEDD
jgi:prepilin-type N-terminal cleavage/methylation domain-containing protein